MFETCNILRLQTISSIVERYLGLENWVIWEVDVQFAFTAGLERGCSGLAGVTPVVGK